MAQRDLEQRIRQLIASHGGGGIVTGGSPKRGLLYHPLPFPELEDVGVAKRDAWDVSDALCRELDKHDVQSILDLGCNVGFHAFRAYRPGRRIVGVDRDHTAVTIANLVAEWQEIPVQFVCGDAKAPPTSEVWDAVLALNVHQWIWRDEGEDSARAFLGWLATHGRLVAFETAHHQSRGWARVPWTDEEEVAENLMAVGLRPYLGIRHTDTLGGKRVTFICKGTD